ncbi:hypothetical protein Tco_0559627, partial [Tanacetum coccineum]
YNGGAVISVRKKGASKGVKSFEALDTMKLRANRIWNEGCLSGRMIRNRAGVIGLLYAGIESEMVAVRDLDNAFNSVAAGLGTGPCLRWRVVCDMCRFKRVRLGNLMIGNRASILRLLYAVMESGMVVVWYVDGVFNSMAASLGIEALFKVASDVWSAALAGVASGNAIGIAVARK